MPKLPRQNSINETKALTKYHYNASSGPNKIIAKNFVLKKINRQFCLKRLIA